MPYFNPLNYPQNPNAPPSLPYPPNQPWNWPANYPQPNHQYLGDMNTNHAAHHQMYYSHRAMLHSANNTAEWHSASTAQNFAQNAQMLQQQQQQFINGSAIANGAQCSTPPFNSGSSSPSTSTGHAPGRTQLNETVNSIGDPQQQQQPPECLPSPPITVSGSEISSPGVPALSLSPHNNINRLSNNSNSPIKINNNTAVNNNNHSSTPKPHQYYEWMKKPSYPSQPAPGKTRTKDKYRVVYTDFQRLELEKEYCTAHYITIRRKADLAQALSLSERQVKIWFQNRRAKERKQRKKLNEPTIVGVQQPKIESGAPMQHSLHSMAMTMPSMRLHPHLHHHPLAVSAHSHQLNQPQHVQLPPPGVPGMGTLPM